MTRHRFDPFSALAGLLSLAFAIAIGARTGPVGLTELQLVGPVAILVLGIALVASGGRTPTAASVPPTADTSGDGPQTITEPETTPEPETRSEAEPVSEPERDQGGPDQQAGERGDPHRGDG